LYHKQINKIMKYIKIDYTLNFSHLCDTKEEVIESCGYEVDEITFEDLLKKIEGEFEIIEVKGDIKWLQED
jgi:hypothetical protein